MEAAMADDTTVQLATRLLAMWDELAYRHVSLGSACACGAGGISLRLEDFELDIVGYLEDAGLRCGVAEVVAFFQGGAAEGEEPLRRLLLDAQAQRLPGAVSDWVLAKVERTLRSFAELHGPRE